MSGELLTTSVDVALDRLRRGGLVAIPTETVYGLAADATDPEAVARIFAAKGRPGDHPLIVHLGGLTHIDEWADHLPEPARVLADACWPGPLTMLLPRGPRVLDVVTGGRPTVGLRVPAHPLTAELLDRFGDGLAAPSANRFGRVSPTTPAHVLADLGEFLDPERDAVLDGGPCPIGVESTIVDCSVDPPQILRPGGVPTEDVRRLLAGHVAPVSGPKRASGMLASHYAPRCRVVLAETGDEARTIANDARAAGTATDVLDLTDDLVAYARTLYAQLRDADRRSVETLVAVLPPAEGLGHAIRDRLLKASAAR